MADPMKKVRSGEKLRIPASAYNAFVDAARWVQKHSAGELTGATPAHRSAGIVLAKNQTGEDRRRFDVLGIDEPVILPDGNLDEFKNKVALAGVVPAVDDANPRHDHTGKFMILQEPLAKDAVGRAIVAGVTPAQVRVVSDTDRFADIDIGACGALKSVPWGSTRILWKQSGLGVKWAVVRLGDRPKFAIFELAGTWQSGPQCQTITSDAGSGETETIHVGGAFRWAKMDGCRPVFYLSDDCTYSATSAEPPQTIWHTVGYPPDQRQSLLDLLERTGAFPAKFGQGDWVWCHYNEQEGRWQVLGTYEDHWRFVLLSELPRCGSALAQLVLYHGGAWCPVDLTFTVNDAVGIVCPDLCNTPTSSGNGCTCGTATSVPAGTYGIAKHYADSGKWEVLALGKGCCGSESSSGESESSSDSQSESESGSDSQSGSQSGPSDEPGSSSGCECPPGTVAVEVLKDQHIYVDPSNGCITVTKDFTLVCQPCDTPVWQITETTCPSSGSESSEGSSDEPPHGTCFSRYVRTRTGSSSGSDSDSDSGSNASSDDASGSDSMSDSDSESDSGSDSSSETGSDSGSASGSDSDSGAGSDSTGESTTEPQCYWRYTRTLLGSSDSWATSSDSQAEPSGSDAPSSDSPADSSVASACCWRYTRTWMGASSDSSAASGDGAAPSAEGTCYARYTRAQSSAGSDAGACYTRYVRVQVGSDSQAS